MWTVQALPPSQLAKNEVYINALHDSMPECDRVDPGTRGDSPASRCYVYCAKPSCHAAVEYMQDHEGLLRSQCLETVYVKGGAVSMRRDDLVDGDLCHTKILGTRPCYNCTTDPGTPIGVTVDGQQTQARLLSTRTDPPSWYAAAGIQGRLPLQFTTDPRYQTGEPHEVATGTEYEIDISGTEFEPHSTLAVWASHPSDDVRSARDAYGRFDNSGITKCDETKCTVRLDPPSGYVVEGEAYKPHLHLTDRHGAKWNPHVRTITLPS